MEKFLGSVPLVIVGSFRYNCGRFKKELLRSLENERINCSDSDKCRKKTLMFKSSTALS